MKNRWMAYAMATALGLGIAGEAMAQTPGGTAAPPAPTNPPAAQKQDGQPGRGAAKGKKVRRHRAKKARAKQTGATQPASPQAQPAPAPQTR